jgi:hypothetical protein
MPFSSPVVLPHAPAIVRAAPYSADELRPKYRLATRRTIGG